MAQNVGTLITAPIRPNDDLDPIASAFANEIKGGIHSKATLADRDLIIEERREWGMGCYVHSDNDNNGLYQLIKDKVDSNIMNNDNWSKRDNDSIFIHEFEVDGTVQRNLFFIDPAKIQTGEDILSSTVALMLGAFNEIDRLKTSNIIGANNKDNNEGTGNTFIGLNNNVISDRTDPLINTTWFTYISSWNSIIGIINNITNSDFGSIIGSYNDIISSRYSTAIGSRITHDKAYSAVSVGSFIKNSTGSVAIGVEIEHADTIWQTGGVAGNAYNFSFGRFINQSNWYNVAIGTGISGTSKLTNTKGYSLILGIGTILAPFYLGRGNPETGSGGWGQIAIGGHNTPTARLDLQAGNANISSFRIRKNTVDKTQLLQGEFEYGKDGRLHFFNTDKETFAYLSDIPTLPTPPTFVGKTLIVDDTNGNDSTAKKGSFEYRYKTIDAALDAAFSNDTISILPGIYVVNSSLWKKDNITILMYGAELYLNTATVSRNASSLSIIGIGYGNRIIQTSTSVGSLTFNITDATASMLNIENIHIFDNKEGKSSLGTIRVRDSTDCKVNLKNVEFYTKSCPLFTSSSNINYINCDNVKFKSYGVGNTLNNVVIAFNTTCIFNECLFEGYSQNDVTSNYQYGGLVNIGPFVFTNITCVFKDCSWNDLGTLAGLVITENQANIRFEGTNSFKSLTATNSILKITTATGGSGNLINLGLSGEVTWNKPIGYKDSGDAINWNRDSTTDITDSPTANIVKRQYQLSMTGQASGNAGLLSRSSTIEHANPSGIPSTTPFVGDIVNGGVAPCQTIGNEKITSARISFANGSVVPGTKGSTIGATISIYRVGYSSRTLIDRIIFNLDPTNIGISSNLTIPAFQTSNISNLDISLGAGTLFGCEFTPYTSDDMLGCINALTLVIETSENI